MWCVKYLNSEINNRCLFSPIFSSSWVSVEPWNEEYVDMFFKRNSLTSNSTHSWMKFKWKVIFPSNLSNNQIKFQKVSVKNSRWWENPSSVLNICCCFFHSKIFNFSIELILLQQNCHNNQWNCFDGISFILYVKMVSSIKLFQFIQKYNRTLGINSPKSNKTCLKNLIFVFCEVQFGAALIAFMSIEANSMLEYGITCFPFSCAMVGVIVYLISIWQIKNCSKLIENCERFIEKRK